MKKLLSTTLAFAFVFSLAACIESSAADSNGKKLIAFSQGEGGNSWRTTNTNDMEVWAKKKGYNFVWTDGNNDASKQLSDIEDILARKPDILIIAPLQQDAISPAYEMVKKAQIPMVTIDRTLNAEPDGQYYKAKIVQDFVEVGRLGAQHAVDVLTEMYGEPKGSILEISGTIGASPAVDQGNGIREVLAKYPNVKIVDSQSGNYNRATSRAVMDDFLNKYPEGSIDILITHCDDAALGALQAMRDAGRTDFYGRIISKNGMRTALKEVIDGTIDTTYQCPPYFGETTITLVEKILNGEQYDSFINVPFKTFDMDEHKAMTVEYYKYLVDNDLDF